MKRRRIVLAGGALLLIPGIVRAACVATQRDALGPFYVKDAPSQSDLCSAAGNNERLTISGRILGAPASSEQGSRLRDANVRESGTVPSSAGVASVSGVTSPKGAPVPPSDGAPDCKPLAGALIEVWQADDKGEYSQVSRSRKDDPRCLLRATLKSGTEGRYAFRTILPGEYPGRPRHIHYRVSMNGYRTLVTQLYFNTERGVDAPRVAKLTRGAAVGSKSPDYQATFDITLEKTY